jgi:lipoteichoic acid synthase
MIDLKNSLQQTYQRLLIPSQHLLVLTASLLFLFLFMRVYEFIAVAASHSLVPHWFISFLLGNTYDILFVLDFAALTAIPFILLSLWNLSAARIYFGLIGAVLLGIHLGLVGYFANTNIPLGADVFGYSWSEITLTVRSSADISLLTFLPFISVLGFWTAASLYSGRIHITGKAIAPFYGIIFSSLLFSSTLSPIPSQFEREANFNLAINKSAFFYQKTWTYCTTSEEIPSSAFRQYPLYRTFPYRDVLGRFFRQNSENPNLVFIIVEGLGRDFVGAGAAYGGFTPFIDSLTKYSLYWENFLSTAGRTFNVLPSMFGSLPYGPHGFMELGGQMPAHQTLISILKQAGYRTNFFYGGNANFDLQDVFLDRQGIDFILDQHQFGPSYTRSSPNEKGFSWGYDDGDVFKRSLEIIAAQTKSPRLDIYLTLSTHEPFSPPHNQLYWGRFDERLTMLPRSEEQKKIYTDYKEVFCTLLYFDDALRGFIEDYQQRSDFKNTIFFITGDHRLIPVPLGEQIDRFHVPLIVYSPLISEPRTFSSISTHSDVTPSVLAFLQGRSSIALPAKASWLSGGIDTAQRFRNIHSLPLMRNKNELIDYIDGLVYLADDQVYRLKPPWAVERISNDSIRTMLLKKLARFKQINRYICENNQLYPNSLPQKQNVLYNPNNDSLFTTLKLDSLNVDQLFEWARTGAFQKRYADARVVCRKLLSINPRNIDVKMLLGRTYAWEKDYETARSIYFDVLHQMPTSTDALSALVDIELWKGMNDRALSLSDSSLATNAGSEALLVRKAQALANLGRTDEAKNILRQIFKSNSNNEEARALKKRMDL